MPGATSPLALHTLLQTSHVPLPMELDRASGTGSAQGHSGVMDVDALHTVGELVLRGSGLAEGANRRAGTPPVELRASECSRG